MAFDLSSITTKQHIKPPICIFYGTPGVGKTTLLAHAPNNVFLPVEDGIAINEVAAFPLVETFQDVLDAISTLQTQDHNFNWFTVDTLSLLQKKIADSVCDENNVNSIEQIGYGKGYVYIKDKFELFIDKIKQLRDTRGMAIALLAHAEVTTFKNPESEDYDRYQIDLDKRSFPLFRQSSDIIGFFNRQVYTRKHEGEKQHKGKDGGRILHLCEQPAYIAKNRYRLPATIQIPEQPNNPWQPFHDALTAALMSAA